LSRNKSDASFHSRRRKLSPLLDYICAELLPRHRALRGDRFGGLGNNALDSFAESRAILEFGAAMQRFRGREQRSGFCTAPSVLDEPVFLAMTAGLLDATGGNIKSD